MLAWHDRFLKIRTQVTMINDAIIKGYPKAQACTHLVKPPQPTSKHVPARIVECSDNRQQVHDLAVRVPSHSFFKLLSEYLGKLKGHIGDRVLRLLEKERSLSKHYARRSAGVWVMYRAWGNPTEIQTEIVS
jgi:hypothetical protein